VFIDETWATTAMARRYGRARRCRRRAAWPLEGHDLRRRPRSGGLTAPSVLDGAINGARFLA
jgi:hypothetical protein